MQGTLVLKNGQPHMVLGTPGADQQVCPVDETGRLRGFDGVWVADASILPSCPEVNPQLSIMALALAVADEVVASAR